MLLMCGFQPNILRGQQIMSHFTEGSTYKDKWMLCKLLPEITHETAVLNCVLKEALLSLPSF